MSIKKKLKALLALNNMTIKELSQKSGVPVNTIYSIMSKDREVISHETDRKISEALQLPCPISAMDTGYFHNIAVGSPDNFNTSSDALNSQRQQSGGGGMEKDIRTSEFEEAMAVMKRFAQFWEPGKACTIKIANSPEWHMVRALLPGGHKAGWNRKVFREGFMLKAAPTVSKMVNDGRTFTLTLNYEPGRKDILKILSEDIDIVFEDFDA